MVSHPTPGGARCYIICTSTRLMMGMMILGLVNAGSIDLLVMGVVVLIFKRKQVSTNNLWWKKMQIGLRCRYIFLNKNDLDFHIWIKAVSILGPDSTQKWIVKWMSVCRHSYAVSKLIDLEHLIVCLSTGFTFLFAGLWLSTAVSFHSLGLVDDVGRASKIHVSMSCLHFTILYWKKSRTQA
jgi:hypothetical protein